MARTHTEIYRPFTGELRAPRFGFLAITSATLRAMMRRKLPLILLYLPPFIATIAFAFIVNTRYAIIEQMASERGPGGFGAALGRTMAQQLLEVRDVIVQFNIQVRYFALLTIAWFGSGLFADDRQHGAHQLYFSKPLSRFGYFLSKFLVVATFGTFALLVPVLVIGLVASFASPDWQFLKDDWPLVLRALGYGAMWIFVVGLLVLAFSSLTRSRAYALAFTFGFIMVTSAIGLVLTGTYEDFTYMSISLIGNFQTIGDWLMGSSWDSTHDDVPLAFAVVGAVVLLCAVLLTRSLRRAEVVG